MRPSLSKNNINQDIIDDEKELLIKRLRDENNKLKQIIQNYIPGEINLCEDFIAPGSQNKPNDEKKESQEGIFNPNDELPESENYFKLDKNRRHQGLFNKKQRNVRDLDNISSICKAQEGGSSCMIL